MNEHDDDLIPPDPRFPERPHTLDFARLSAAVAYNDALADMLDVGAVLECDMESLIYLAKGRAGFSFGGEHMVRTAHLAIYLDAFQLGVEFERRGGHRED
jgi:hypothetical protein